MKSLWLGLVVAALFFPLSVLGQRKEILLNHNWRFRFAREVNGQTQRVDLPHTWNAQDALSSDNYYKRGIGNYTKRIYIRPEWKGKRLFVRFEGANSVTDFFVNGRHVGEHRGGYGAFIFEITDKVKYGTQNELLARVNNGEQLDVMPLVGDFNFYGGIYRDVHLLISDPVCISPLDYASSGLYLVQNKVTPSAASVTARVMLSNNSDEARPTTLQLTISDGKKNIHTQEKKVMVPAHATAWAQSLDFELEKPHLWNGTTDPFLYTATVSLTTDGKETDRVEQPLGLRFYHVSPSEGFFLNGKHLPLRGVCRHQERAEVGNALHREHHEEDIALIKEMGANAIRLAHYPQASYVYDLTDRNGMVVWAEIPFVGPGGYADKGFVDLPSFRANGKEQLKEMIRQHYNHPSICFWGLFNELKEVGDNPIEYIKELDTLAHQEDPTRPTTSASNQGGAINDITDLIAWNRYDGWYGATPATLATWLDRTHAQRPDLKIGISEYGAGASIYHQQDSLVQPVANGRWHPENWQTEYHIQNWKIIHSRPFIWGTFVWNMFDFGAAHRTEGDRNGINDKGLVTHDRKTKKDAFFFYKANWNPEPMLYLAEKRCTQRTKATTDVRVFTNCKEVSLWVNGKPVSKAKPDEVNVCTFKNVRLNPGDNHIVVKGRANGKDLQDNTNWFLQ